MREYTFFAHKYININREGIQYPQFNLQRGCNKVLHTLRDFMAVVFRQQKAEPDQSK